MQTIKIPFSKVSTLLTGKELLYPKYSTQLMNLANQNAQGTRPRVVGQMSELIQEFSGNSYSEWEEWYKNKYPMSIEDATEKVYNMIKELQSTFASIDRALVRQWIEDLVLTKTFSGLKLQEAILKAVSIGKGLPYRVSTKKEESKGIDGYIGSIAVSIKPSTYKTMTALNEMIDCQMIFYNKTKTGIVVQYDF